MVVAAGTGSSSSSSELELDSVSESSVGCRCSWEDPEAALVPAFDDVPTEVLGAGTGALFAGAENVDLVKIV